MTLGLSAAIWLVLYHWETYNSYIKFLFDIWFSIIYYISFLKKSERERLAIILLPSPIIGYTIAYDITRGLPLFGLSCLFGKTVSDEWKLIEESDSRPLITYISLRKSRGRHMQYFHWQTQTFFLLPPTKLLIENWNITWLILLAIRQKW